MPWNESHLDIRSDHLDPSRFDRDTIRTIAISEPDGIEAVVGKLPGRDYELTFSFLFAKSKGWTMQKAKDWFRKNEHTAEVPLGYWPVGGAAALNRLTVGDLVGKTMRTTIDFPSLETYQSNAANSRRLREEIGQPLSASEARSNPIQICPHDSPCRTLHASLNLPCLGILCGLSEASAATVNANGTDRFDPMRVTVGDLVGKNVEKVQAADADVPVASGPLFNPMRATVGDLSARGHASGRTISIQPGDIAMHPSKIRMCSR